MPVPEKYKYALQEHDGYSIVFKAGEEPFKAGIREIRFKYVFIDSNRIDIWPGVTGAGWKVGLVSAFDLSNIFIGSAGLSVDQKENAVVNELNNGNPFWRYEVKNEKPPYICDLGMNFGGIAIGFVVVVTKPKKPYYFQSFVFVARNLLPTLTFVFGVGSDFVMARHEGQYKVLE